MPDFSGYKTMMQKSTRIIAAGFVFCVFCVFRLSAQQEAQFTQNMFTRMAINPAFAGSSGNISVTGLMRQQWVGFKDNDGEKVAPGTFLMSVDMPVSLLRGGLGLSIMNDKLGFEQNIGLRLNYAYRTLFADGEIAFGPVIGFVNKTIDFSKFKPTQPNDPILTSAEEKAMMVDLGVGVYYESDNQYYIGISTSQLMQTGASLGIETANFNLSRHYYFQGGYTYVLPNNPLVRLEPSLLIKTDFVSTQFDINGLAIYNEKVWGGITYRFQDAIALMVGVRYKSMQIGYAYDLTTSRLLGAGSTGSHEIMLNYTFKLDVDKNPKSYRNTRFL